MKSQKEESIACSECDCEIAAVILNEEGKRVLKIFNQIELTIIDKEKNVGSIRCPRCGSKTRTNLEFWRQF
jgi:DNA-directed RNA polymerase subunit RPC12/RpoP